MPDLGRVGVFTSARKVGDRAAEVAQAAEELGYDAIWVADVRGDLTTIGQLLAATGRIRVGSAILSMWDLEPGAAANAWAVADAQGPGRAIAGIGVSHSALVERSGQSYDRPLTRLRGYLDELDGLEGIRIPTAQRMIGANGPKMLQLAGKRTIGALTYLVTPERTAKQRRELGPDAVLAPEVKVALAPDRESARALGRSHLEIYLKLPNYLGNLERMGFTCEDFAGGGSDRLVDTLVVGPNVEDVARRVAEHRDAGADHVCLQVLSHDELAPLDQWRELAPAVCGTPEG